MTSFLLCQKMIQVKEVGRNVEINQHSNPAVKHLGKLLFISAEDVLKVSSRNPGSQNQHLYFISIKIHIYIDIKMNSQMFKARLSRQEMLDKAQSLKSSSIQAVHG